MKPTYSEIRSALLFFIAIAILTSCSEKKLPILGKRHFENGDTIYTQIPDFNLQNQFGTEINSQQLRGKIHIADFFFTSCPTICPKTMRSMIKIADHFKSANGISYLCFSIDYRKDTLERLKSYYDKLGINYTDFYLLHIPTKEEIKRISEGYMSIAVEDSSAPGGFDHSGWLMLVDKKGYIRSYCLGTDEKDVERFILDIEILLHEN